MSESRVTLSLADVARLAGVQRPVVSMWRKRPVAGKPFPLADANGRFAPDRIVEWLEATGRGNNPEVRADLAIEEASSASVTSSHRSALIALLAARVMLDAPLASYEMDELIDEVDALDPDDEFLLSELESLDQSFYPSLVEQADAIAEAAWHPRAAYERLLDAEPGPSRDDRMHPALVELLAGLCRALLGPDGQLIDAQGECCDVALKVCADEGLASPAVTMPASKPIRGAQRRYRVHGVVPRQCHLTDDWVARPGSVTLIRVADDSGFDLIDEARLHLTGECHILALGPAAVLTDALPAELETRRDEFIRLERTQPAVLRAAVRLPAGLTRGGSRQHLALWLLGPEPKVGARGGDSLVWLGDLAGAKFDLVTQQALLDDLLAVAHGRPGRAFTTLRAARRAAVAADGGVLVSAGRALQTALPVVPADDAVRLAELRRELEAPLPEVFAHEPLAVGDGEARQVRLGEAQRAKQIKLFPGARLGELPSGATPLWTAAAVQRRQAASVDLISLTRQHPEVRLTEPRDVVFTTAGKPAAVLDLSGGSAVAYPARVLRVVGGRLCPAAIVDAINAVPAGNPKWRTWQVPEVQIDLGLAGEIVESLQYWENQLRDRQLLLDELRRLITRSILSGAIQMHSNEQKGS